MVFSLNRVRKGSAGTTYMVFHKVLIYEWYSPYEESKKINEELSSISTSLRSVRGRGAVSFPEQRLVMEPGKERKAEKYACTVITVLRKTAFSIFGIHLCNLTLLFFTFIFSQHSRVRCDIRSECHLY